VTITFGLPPDVVVAGFAAGGDARTGGDKADAVALRVALRLPAASTARTAYEVTAAGAPSCTQTAVALDADPPIHSTR